MFKQSNTSSVGQTVILTIQNGPRIMASAAIHEDHHASVEFRSVSKLMVVFLNICCDLLIYFALKFFYLYGAWILGYPVHCYLFCCSVLLDSIHLKYQFSCMEILCIGFFMYCMFSSQWNFSTDRLHDGKNVAQRIFKG
jgi:hypothetical protein